MWEMWLDRQAKTTSATLVEARSSDLVTVGREDGNDTTCALRWSLVAMRGWTGGKGSQTLRGQVARASAPGDNEDLKRDSNSVSGEQPLALRGCSRAEEAGFGD